MHALLLLLATLAAAQPAATIEATIAGTSAPLHVNLLARDGDDRWKVIAARGLFADTRHVRFDGLAAGVYQLHVRSDRDTEQLSRKVIVGAGDRRSLAIDVAPFEVAGRVTQAGVPLAPATLLLRNSEFGWHATLPLDADGTFHATLWQRGEYAATVQAKSLTQPYREEVRVAGVAPVRLAIDVPGGVVSGVVRDAASGAPIAGAGIGLMTRGGGHERYASATCDAHGAFRFTGVADGAQKLSVLAPGFLQPQPFVFDLGAQAHARSLDVKLERGRPLPIVVASADGTPVDGARVFAIVDGAIVSRASTDDDGRATCAIPRDASAVLFAVAPRGGFASRRVSRDDGAERLRIDLPRSTSSLLIRATTTDGEAMPPLSLLMRYNGALVPLDAADALAALQQLKLETGASSEAHLANIPAGTYEFWPYRTEEEAEAILASSDSFAAPIQVNVRAGENKIAVKFARR